MKDQENQDQYCVYHIVNKLTGDPIYIGQGHYPGRPNTHNGRINSSSPGQRAASKMRDGEGPETFECVVLETFDNRNDAYEMEIELITKHGRIGYEEGGILRNISSGGSGGSSFKKTPEQIEKGASRIRGRKQSPEHIEKVATANLGKKRSPEFSEQMSQLHRGRDKSEDEIQNLIDAAKRRFESDPSHIENLAESNRGRKASEETKAKMSESHKGHEVSLETRAKISAANKGKVNSPEALARMAETKRGVPSWNKGIPMSEEARQKLSETNTGKKQSQETIERRRASMKGKVLTDEVKRSKIIKSSEGSVRKLALRGFTELGDFNAQIYDNLRKGPVPSWIKVVENIGEDRINEIVEEVKSSM